MKIDGISGIVVILVASFAIDRIVTGLLFVLSFVKPWARMFPDPGLLGEGEKRNRAEKKHKLLYFTCAGILGMGVLSWWGGVRTFSVLGFPAINPYLDIVITGLILMGGSERIAAILNLPGAIGGHPSGPRPIEVTGKLVLEGGSGTKTLPPP